MIIHALFTGRIVHLLLLRLSNSLGLHFPCVLSSVYPNHSYCVRDRKGSDRALCMPATVEACVDSSLCSRAQLEVWCVGSLVRSRLTIFDGFSAYTAQTVLSRDSNSLFIYGSMTALPILFWVDRELGLSCTVLKTSSTCFFRTEFTFDANTIFILAVEHSLPLGRAT